MFQRISNTWGLMGASWNVLKQDKSLLLFPLLSSICCVMVMATFAIPIWATGSWRPPGHAATQLQQLAYYGTLFVFYLCNYFVIIFFNAGIVSCAVRRLTGEESTVSDGLWDAFGRLHLILAWALVSATVGLVLRMIEDKSKWVGQIVAALLGVAWTVATYMVVPILVVEGKGPLAAMKESTKMLLDTWGERLVSRAGFGLIFFLLALPAFALVAAGLVSHNGLVIVLTIAVAVIYVVALALVNSALQSIFHAAVYLYARDGKAQGFPDDLLARVLQPK